MHHNHVWVCGIEPAGEKVLGGDVGGEIPAMAFVVAVVVDSAALGRECADHVEVLCAVGDKVVVEESAPAAGGAGDAVAEGHDADGEGRGESEEEDVEEAHVGGRWDAEAVTVRREGKLYGLCRCLRV